MGKRCYCNTCKRAEAEIEKLFSFLAANYKTETHEGASPCATAIVVMTEQDIKLGMKSGLIEDLEKENAELKRKLAKWMPGRDGQALRAELREKEPT